MIRFGILFLVGIVAAGLIRTAIYVGYFKEAHFKQVNSGEWTLVGLSHEGPYHQIVSKIQSVENQFKEWNIPCPQSFGLYEDNPSLTEEERLRSFAGCVVDTKDLAKIPANNEKHFEQRHLQFQSLLMGTFDGAPSVGPYKVYRPAEKKAQELNKSIQWPVLEIYEIREDNSVSTKYYFQLKP